MSQLLDKISSYNIFNYLLPGVLFAVLAGDVVGHPLIQRDLVTGAFVYYFLGMVVSRFGSLVIEPLLKKVGFTKFATYKDFVVASQKDPKVDVLLEVSNTYRTLAALFSLLLLVKLYARIEEEFPGLKPWDSTILVLILLVVFVASYRKQTAYVTERVKANG